MNDKLLIVTKVKKTIEYLDKILDNFPRNENFFKSRIINTMYDMLENIYMANIINTNEKILYKQKVVTNIRMVDYYLKICALKKYISLKKYNIIGNHLLEIHRMVIAWLKSEKSK